MSHRWLGHTPEVCRSWRRYIVREARDPAARVRVAERTTTAAGGPG